MTKRVSWLCVLVLGLGLTVPSAWGASLKTLPKSKLKYSLTLPAEYKKTESYPLVVALHGMGGDADGFMEFWGQMLSGRSVIIACPQGSRKIGQGFAWDGKDVAGINECTMAVMKAYSVDKKNILLTGFSQGCSVGYAVVAGAPNTYRCFAGFANGLPSGLRPQKVARAAKNTAIFACIGKKDPNYWILSKLRRFLKRTKFTHKTIDPDGLGHTLNEDVARQAIAFWDSLTASTRK